MGRFGSNGNGAALEMQSPQGQAGSTPATVYVFFWVMIFFLAHSLSLSKKIFFRGMPPKKRYRRQYRVHPRFEKSIPKYEISSSERWVRIWSRSAEHFNKDPEKIIDRDDHSHVYCIKNCLQCRDHSQAIHKSFQYPFIYRRQRPNNHILTWHAQDNKIQPEPKYLIWRPIVVYPL